MDFLIWGGAPASAHLVPLRSPSLGIFMQNFITFEIYAFHLGSFSIQDHLENLISNLRNSNVVLHDKMISNQKVVNYKVS